MVRLIKSVVGRAFLLARAWANVAAPAAMTRAQGAEGVEGVLRLLEEAADETAIEILRAMGASVGARVRVNRGLVLHNVVGQGVPLHIGDACHIGRQVFLDLADAVEIGHRSTISMRVIILTHMSSGDSEAWSGSSVEKKKPVIIEEDVYVGAGAILLPGVRLRRGCLVGAGAVVTREVGEGETVIGVPARRLERRQDISLTRRPGA